MKKTIITIVSLIVVLVVVAYGYEFIFKKPVIESPTVQEDVFLPTLEVKEQYKNSVYTFVGSVSVPTPCYTVKSESKKISEKEYQIIVSTIPPSSDVVCAQVVTDKTYKVSFTAPADIKVSAFINGIQYQLNRFLIPSDQNIDTFKLEIKG